MSNYQLTENQILTALSIVGIQTQESSDNVMIRCPFHNDNSPSMSIVVNSGSSIFGLCKCWSCGKTVNITTLIKHITGKSIYALLDIETDYNNFQFLNNLNMYEKKKNDYSDRGIHNINGKFLKITEDTTAYNYLVNKRKIDSSLIDKFELTYTKYAVINEDKELNKKTYFINRIVTPIYYKQKLVNLDGRDFTEIQSPKVLYPRNSLKTLFNYDNLNRRKPLYLTEGLIDLFGIYHYIDANVTSTLGSNLNELQIEQLNEFTELILLKNSDDAGNKMLSFLDENYDGDLYVVNFTGQNDVNDMIRYSTIKQLETDINNKILYTEYLLNKYELF